jgi:hypothetical protein
VIRGCRIGVAEAYLRKLKQALGNTIRVIAPKHFHYVDEQPNPAGFFEYMSYSFNINRPTRFGNRDEAVRDFAAGRRYPGCERPFLRIDDKPVPPKLWPDWIPGKELNTEGEHSMPGTIVSPITNATESLPGFFRYHKRDLLTQDGSFALQKDPGDENGRKKAVREDLVKRLERYRDDHPFQEYVRRGYKTMDEFMDGWKWTFRYDSRNHTMYYNATRHEYTVKRPIVDLKTNKLILNYYPSGGEGTVIEHLSTDDPRFFASV